MALDQTQEGGTLVALPTGGAPSGSKTEESLAGMLHAQFLSREFNDVYASTELRENECIIIAGMFMVRFISLIIATDIKEETGLPHDTPEYKNIHARLQIKARLMSDPVAMVFAEVDSWLFAFGVSRQSLKRQSRHEAMHVSTASLLRQLGVDAGNEQIGLGGKVLSKLGIGPARIAYIPKDKK